MGIGVGTKKIPNQKVTGLVSSGLLTRVQKFWKGVFVPLNVQPDQGESKNHSSFFVAAIQS